MLTKEKLKELDEKIDSSITDEELDEIEKEIMDIVPFSMSLYLDSEINEESVLPIIKGIRKANYPLEMNLEEVLSPDLGGDFVYKKFTKIILNINSPGGCIDSGLALLHEIENSEIPIECVITKAHSMAFLIAIACNKRKITKYGKLMWHDTNLGIYDKVKSIKEYIDILEHEKYIIHETIISRTSLTLQELNEIIDKKTDRYFLPHEALEKNIVDEII